VFDGNRPAEYSFLPLTHYSAESQRTYESFAKLLDTYFGERDRAALVTDRASDLKHTVSSAISRVLRKIEAQNAELVECEEGESFKRDADLIVANIYRLKKGDGEVRLTDYSEMNDDGEFAERVIKLDTRLSPSENAQKLYKKYNKCNTARRELTRQLELANAEADYLYTVRDALSRAETGADLAGIRLELEKGGYLKQKKGAAPAKSIKSTPLKYVTTNGYEVLCGRNNLQNEEITFKTAAKDDYWFHAKGVPGSHVLMKTDGEEPPALDMTEAAEIAAFNSTAEGNNIPVDYAFAKHIKKPAGGKPGLVIYHTNYTAYVTPDPERIAAMKVK
jgi:predicted ribosome quality control (RQC) complex YloA/Tae2 family protein